MASAYTKSLITTFVTNYGNAIIDAITDTGLFFAGVVAVLSVESANGTSALAVDANNFGSIKGAASNGILMDTTEYDSRTPVQEYFKKYNNFNEFIADYVSILTTNQRYISGGVFTATSPEAQVTAMVNAGYATMTAKAYLAGGVQDRINATRDLIPLGLISSSAAPTAKALTGGGCCNPLACAPFGVSLSCL